MNASTKRFPTPRQQRAIELGADELHSRIEWALRNRPHALRNARRRYQDFCTSLLCHLDQTYRCGEAK